MNHQLDEYAPLWTSHAKDYVLVCRNPASTERRSYMIFRRKGSNRRGTALIIEDDNIVDVVIQRMIEAGVEIVDTVPRD